MESFDAAIARAEAAVHDDHFDARAACEALLAVLQTIREPIQAEDAAPPAPPEE